MAFLESELGEDAALFTDLYELTMAASYFAEGMHRPATFSFSVRHYPPGRGYFIAAGVDDVLRYLENLHFSASALDYLRATGLFTPEFLEFLAALRFTGDVDAMAEGTVCFVNEPLLEVTAPLIEAQLIETFVINRLHLQTLLATKAARCVLAARRTHGTDAGMQSARCAYLAGAAGTSNVLAGQRWGLPIFGTMAHSYVECFDDETGAFRAFVRTFPAGTTLLVDTYDTLAGVRHAVTVARQCERKGSPLQAVRLDSGDLDSLSRQARALLDEAGLHEVKIFASGGLDEYAVDALVRAGAPINGFGVGTSMGVSGDAPLLDCAYKLVEYDGRARLKLSPHKVSLAGRKQVWRAAAGSPLTRDCVALRDEPVDAVGRDLRSTAARLEPLLRPVMRGGRLQQPRPTLAESRARTQAELARLDDAYKDLRTPPRFPVIVSSALADCQRAAEERARITQMLP